MNKNGRAAGEVCESPAVQHGYIATCRELDTHASIGINQKRKHRHLSIRDKDVNGEEDR